MSSVAVGLGTCGISAGGRKVLDAFQQEAQKSGGAFTVGETGCVGLCYKEVLIRFTDSKGQQFLYGEVTPDRVGRIVQEHVLQGRPIDEWLVMIGGAEAKSRDGFLDKQKKIVLQNCGQIDPHRIEDYLAAGGYRALEKVLKENNPEQVIDVITRSGLRGRGGGGFPTGTKWKFCRAAKGSKKYVICNADEGDPGAFMDRSVLEGDPHAVLEGMCICAFAIGADEGYIYVRAEYPHAVRRLHEAVQKARDKRFLGKGILGSDFKFDIKIKEGAGAFVCGEETALIGSIEGRRGTPRFRPPFPAQSGLFGKPTNINNVETFANVPWIILNGAEAFAAMGTADSKGTKVFALTGRIKRSGLAEVPMGISINEIIHDVGGGIIEDKKFKAVQLGGPSGGCIPASMGELKIDYQQINSTGAIMGSGGLVVMDETTCMVDVAKYFLTFTQNESCGKCTFCRIGTKRMLEMLERITEGKGKQGDIEALLELADKIRANTLCGLGQTAPNPVLTTIRYFRNEYEDHIQKKKCTAHHCPSLVTYGITESLCTGCVRCLRACPSGAITGEKKKPHKLDTAKCTKCGKCFEVCNFDAVTKD
jgi:NADH-quinone oxidoreductase subunit F